MAVAECLNGHGIQLPLMCHVCNQDIEYICHVLFNCSIALAVWINCGISLPQAGFSLDLHENFHLLFKLMEDVTVDEKLRLSLLWFV